MTGIKVGDIVEVITVASDPTDVIMALYEKPATVCEVIDGTETTYMVWHAWQHPSEWRSKGDPQRYGPFTADRLIVDPPGPHLQAKNRRYLAQVLDWPAGVVYQCERIDAAHPGWYTTWSFGGWPGHDKAGYYSVSSKARRRLIDGEWRAEPPAYGATPAALAEVIETWPWREDPCLSDWHPLTVPEDDAAP